MKTAISIPDPIFDAAEKFAKRTGVSRSQLYAKAMKAYLKGHQNDSVTKKLNEIYSDEASHLDNAIQSIQFLSLPKDEW
jgi:metal-responsive CopG/Arc/MetJ family transcriptional regulator